MQIQKWNWWKKSIGKGEEVGVGHNRYKLKSKDGQLYWELNGLALKLNQSTKKKQTNKQKSML